MEAVPVSAVKFFYQGFNNHHLTSLASLSPSGGIGLITVTFCISNIELVLDVSLTKVVFRLQPWYAPHACQVVASETTHFIQTTGNGIFFKANHTFYIFVLFDASCYGHGFVPLWPLGAFSCPSLQLFVH